MYRKLFTPMILLFYLGLILLSVFYFRSHELVSQWIFYLIGIIAYSFYILAGIKSKTYVSSWRRAEKDELFREDNILLNGSVFLEALIALFLTYNVIISKNITEFIIITTVILTASFYIIRSYAHIRNKGIFRWYSIVLFINLLSSFILLLSIIYVENINPNLLLNPFLSFPLIFIPIIGIPSAIVFLEVDFKKRYNF